MAKFIDGAGTEHEMVVRNQGHLEEIQERRNLQLDKLFMHGKEEILTFLYMDNRTLADVFGDLCGLDENAAKAMRRSLDVDAFERGRDSLLQALADFCPRELQALAKKQIQSIKDALQQLVGSNKDTKLADS